MIEILIKKDIRENGWIFNVEVKDNNSSTHHEVFLSHDNYENVFREKAPPENIVKKSFEFLLKREPKESIMSKFDLEIIGRYFPEFEKEIMKVL